MEGAASVNGTEDQPVATNAPEGNQDLPGKFYPCEAQQESEQAAMSVPQRESVGGNSESNNEKEEEVRGDGEYGMFRTNATRHVWPEHMSLITSKRRDEDAESSSGGKEIETIIL